MGILYFHSVLFISAQLLVTSSACFWNMAEDEFRKYYIVDIKWKRCKRWQSGRKGTQFLLNITYKHFYIQAVASEKMQPELMLFEVRCRFLGLSSEMQQINHKQCDPLFCVT